MLALIGLWLLFAGTALPCPPMCQSCSAHTAECEQVSSLSDVLVGLSRYTESILLRHGNLSKIPEQSFTRFNNLRFLSITGFLFSALKNLTFSSMHIHSLRRLDLSHNQLLSCTIDPMAFSSLSFLDELILTNNSLDILRRSWFSDMPLLSKLFLGFNQILYLAPRTFESLAKLRELDVSSNLIQYLPMDAFYGLPLLHRLDLSSNRILFINREVFQSLLALRYLLLFQNRLTILPALPSSVIILFLHDNPWNCSCQLANSIGSLIDKIQTPTGVVCGNPPSLAGMQATSARPEGCRSSSPPSSSSPGLSSPGLSSPGLSSSSSSLPSSSSSSSSSSSHSSSSSLAASSSPSQKVILWLLVGILGGLLVGVMLCLMCCCCIPGCCPCLFRGSSWNCCAPFARRSRSAECVRPASQKPVFALLETDKVVGELRVGERDGGERGRRSPVPTRCCCCHRRSVHRMSDNWACGTREQAFAWGEDRFYTSPFPQVASHQAERCAMGMHCETRVDGQPIPRLGSVPSPYALTHPDYRDGGLARAGSERAMVCANPPKPNEPWRGAINVGAPCNRSESFSRCYDAGAATRGRGAESTPRLWPKTSVKRRHCGHSVDGLQPPWSGKPHPSDRLPPLHEGHKRQKRTPPGKPSHDETCSSSLSSTSLHKEENSARSPYIEMLSIGHRSVRKERVPQPAASAPPPSNSEHRAVGNPPQDAGVPPTRNPSAGEKAWRCRKCGRKEAQKPRTKKEPACGSSGRPRPASATHLPSSDKGTASLAQRGSHMNIGRLRVSGEMLGSHTV